MTPNEEKPKPGQSKDNVSQPAQTVTKTKNKRQKRRSKASSDADSSTIIPTNTSATEVRAPQVSISVEPTIVPSSSSSAATGATSKTSKKQEVSKGLPSKSKSDDSSLSGKMNKVKISEPPKKANSGSNKPKKKAGGDDSMADISIISETSVISESGEDGKKRRNANAEDALDELEQLTGMSLKRAPAGLRLRPQLKNGIDGKKVSILTNFFMLKIKGSDVYQYDVSFDSPDKSGVVVEEIEVGRKFRRVTKKIYQQLLSDFATSSPVGSQLFAGKSYAFDGDRIMITNKPLPIDESPDGYKATFKSSETGSPAYQIRLKKTNTVSLEFNHNTVNRSNVLQMLDIITKSYAFKHDIVYGSKIFFDVKKRARIPMNIRNYPSPFDLAFGYHQSTRFCEAGVVQNIDRASAVLYREGPLLDRLVEKLGLAALNRRFSPRDIDELKEFRALRIRTQYRGFEARHTIRSFTRTPCNETTFPEGNNRKSVLSYFKEHYKIDLKYPNLPCIEVGHQKYLPIELCELMPDQRKVGKLRDELIRILSQHATSQKPDARARETQESARSIASNEALSSFGISLSTSMVTVTGRVLPPPRLKYRNEAQFGPNNGEWNMQQPKQKNFLNSRGLAAWAMLVLETRKIDQQICINFVNRLMEVGLSVGLEVKRPSVLAPVSLRDLRNTMVKLKSTVPGLQLIICIMPEVDEMYTTIKTIGDTIIGVPTQIVLDKHYDARCRNRQKLFDTAYLSNLLLKINSKIGGVNLGLADISKPSLLKGNTMVVGIDVNHPSPGDTSPSIAAVVGSLNDDFSNYHSSIKINPSRDETVNIASMILPILEEYKKHRNNYPDNIVVYRDGVSEGYFAYVLAYEIVPLRAALAFIKKPVKVTYIIVQKRHNARFFPNDQNRTRSGNILPGCVIDSVICHYRWFDFYLCSQNSFLGTARPGKYTVLWDDNFLAADDLQKMTYYLCYLFARSTKSIADPAPARYAHHAAARGKVHLKSQMREGQKDAEEKELEQAIKVDHSLQNVLYFI